MNNLSPGQKIALDYHLSEYPKYKSFEEILDMVEEGKEDVLICASFTYWGTDYLLDMIYSLAKCIDSVVIY